MTDDYAVISPRSWEYRLMAAVVIAVEQRIAGPDGSPRTRWNGWVFEEPDPESLGSAHANGTLTVSVRKVLEPLRRARDLDRPLTDAEAYTIRDAMNTLVHEAAHFMAHPGDDTAPEAYPFDDAETVDDEGRVEQWTLRNADKVISDVFPDAGLGQIEAQVLAQSNINAYLSYTAANRQLDKAIAKLSGLTTAEVTQKLMCADDTQRWNVAVDMVIDERLVEPGLMPEADRADVRHQLVAPLRASLAGLVDVQADESLGTAEETDAGTKAAQEAIAGLDTELKRIERKYRIDGAARQQSQGVRGRGDPAGHKRRGDLSPPDLERLRAVTAAQAAAAGATRHAALGSTQQAADGADPAAPEQADGARPRGHQFDRPQPGSPQQTPHRG